MTKEGREKAKKILGEGKWYEVQLYGGKISAILPNQSDFDFDRNFDWWRVSFFQEVTERTDSCIVKEIHSIFNCNIKILAYSDYYCSIVDDGDTVFKELGNNKSFVTDVNCKYLVCTPNKKTIISKWNTTENLIMSYRYQIL